MTRMRLTAASVSQLCLLACCFAVAGCGDSSAPRLAQVTGTVTYQGKPLAGAYVSFAPEEPGQRAASGSTDASGKYRLTTFTNFDGAVLGKHRVMIRGEEPPDDPNKAADDITLKRGKLLTPRKYTDPATSGLTAEVADKSNVFDFTLTD